MTQAETVRTEDADVSAALQTVLTRHFRREQRIAHLERRPYAYGSSFALDELDVLLEHNTRLELLLKDLSPHSLLENARRFRPDFLYDAAREISTYQHILANRDMGTATFYGSVMDRTVDRYWLFLEKVSGRELYQMGELELWEEAARWLARWHCSFDEQELTALAQAGHWPRHDEDYFRRWPDRAAAFARQKGANLDRVTEGYDAVIQRLLNLPATFIHGEFYPSNILVGTNHGAIRICPVDWEMAALSPGLIDLAALTGGEWSEDERATIAQAYYSALSAVNRPDWRDFSAALDLCRLHLAVQWLGWSPEWQPPPEHVRDWYSEALRLAERCRCVT
jgi:hypothetical protein